MLAKALSAATAAAVEKLYVEDVFSTWLYTGNDTGQTITNGIDLAGEGGLVWTKGRDALGGFNYGHNLFDTERGVRKYLISNNTNAEFTTVPAGYSLTSFNSDGFSLGTNFNDENKNSLTLASWTFRKAPKFFDVVTYTGTGSATTIAHNLGSAPGCVIIKRTDTAGFSWQVWHRSVTQTNQFGGYLNTQDAFAATGDALWGTPTSGTPDMNSSTFSLGTAGGVNASGATYVAYLFAHDAGGFSDSGNESVIKCGSYTGSGTSGSLVVDLGWEPQWVMIKAVSTGGTNYDWAIVDNMRGFLAPNASGQTLQANTSAAEFNQSVASVTANGFSPIGTSSVSNQTGVTYIYIAIRRGPMKTPTDATKVLKANTRTGTGANTSVTGIGFTPDLVVTKTRTSGVQDNGAFWFDRLRVKFKYLISSSADAENTTTTGYALAGTAQETADIVQLNNINRTGDTAVDWFFRRAPGFFDVAAFTSDSSGFGATYNHSLGVTPELVIIKSRGAVANWYVYNSALASDKLLYLDSNVGIQTALGGSGWCSVSSTQVVITGTLSNNNLTHVSYLFASCPGVSKVGSYTGTGTTQQINCGFTAGARFVLIKRTDSTGDWYVWDTARGIISGNDPYLLINSTAAEVTSTDYIDPLNSGFEISSTAPAAINANGGSFIFLAIA